MGVVTKTSNRSRPQNLRVANSVANATPTTLANNVANSDTCSEMKSGPQSIRTSGLLRDGRFAGQQKAVLVHDVTTDRRIHQRGKLARGIGALPVLADHQGLLDRLVARLVDQRVLAALGGDGK